MITAFGIDNIYRMLSYTFQILKEEAFTQISKRKMQSMGDMVASIMSKGIKKQVMKGLDKQYITRQELLTTMRGSIDVSETMRGFTMIQKKVVCNYDEFSVDSYMNRILKTAAQILISSDTIQRELRVELSRAMVAFAEVGTIDPHVINWSQLIYNRNNKMYKMLMNLSYLVIVGMRSQTGELCTFLDSHEMQALYSRFIVEYIRYWYPDLDVEVPSIDLALLDEAPISILKVTDIYVILRHGSQVLILAIPYYDEELLSTEGKKPQEIMLQDLALFKEYVDTVVKEYSLNPFEQRVQAVLLHGQFDNKGMRKVRTSASDVLIETAPFDIGATWYYVELQITRILNRVFGESLRKKEDSILTDKRRRTASGVLIGSDAKNEF